MATQKALDARAERKKKAKKRLIREKRQRANNKNKPTKIVDCHFRLMLSERDSLNAGATNQRRTLGQYIMALHDCDRERVSSEPSSQREKRNAQTQKD